MLGHPPGPPPSHDSTTNSIYNNVLQGSKPFLLVQQALLYTPEPLSFEGQPGEPPLTLTRPTSPCREQPDHHGGAPSATHPGTTKHRSLTLTLI